MAAKGRCNYCIGTTVPGAKLSVVPLPEQVSRSAPAKEDVDIFRKPDGVESLETNDLKIHSSILSSLFSGKKTNHDIMSTQAKIK